MGDDDQCLILSGVTGHVLKALVEALYKGTVTLTGKHALKQFEDVLTVLNSFGILLNLRPVINLPDDHYDFTENIERPEIHEPEVGVEEMEESETEEARAEAEEAEEELMKLVTENEEEPEMEELPEPEISQEDDDDVMAEVDEMLADLEKEESSAEAAKPVENPEEALKETIDEVIDEVHDQVVDEVMEEMAPEEPKKRGRGRKKKEDKAEKIEKAKPETEEEIPVISARPKRGSKRKQHFDEKYDDSSKDEESTSKTSKKEEKPSPSPKKRNRNEPEVEDDSPKRRRRTDKNSSKDEAKKPNFDNLTPEKMNEKVKEGQKKFIEWLQNEGFLRKTPPVCSTKDCSNNMKLELDKEDIDNVVWKCTKCPSKSKEPSTPVSVREGSIFGRVKKHTDSLSWIIKIILCWSDNTSLNQCQQLTGADVDKIFFWYDECRDYYGTL